jgi:methionine aminopeptidase
MCTIIKADYLLASVLADRPSVSFDLLNKLRHAIESSCEDVVVDVSCPEIGRAIEYYPQIFTRDCGEVIRTEVGERLLNSEFREWVFTHSVPPDVHQRVRAVIEGGVE